MNRRIKNIKADNLMVLRQVLEPRGFVVERGSGGRVW